MSDPTTPIEDRLDEILRTVLTAYYDYITEHDIIKAAEEYNEKNALKTAKTNILDLFAHLASEAKPEVNNKDKLQPMFESGAIDWNKYCAELAYIEAIDTYYNNILKILGRE